jgi:DNA polymerase III subunit gamma/tau
MTVSYQMSSRKYRPQRFSEIVGQEAIVTTLKNAIHLRQVAQCYLFCGSHGTGKTSIARILSKALNCLNLQEGEPCCQCTCCQEIAGGYSLDVLEIDGASHRGIDDIRSLNDTVHYVPSRGAYKIYIIDEAHMLTKEAFNALLKTLEEPPKHVKFFLATTEIHKVLPTIVSRCQKFDLQSISFPIMVHKLKNILQDRGIAFEEQALERIASLSGGSLRDAEMLLDQVLCFGQFPLKEEVVVQALNLPPIALFENLDGAIREGDFSFAWRATQEILQKGIDIAHLAQALCDHFQRHLQKTLEQPQNALYSIPQLFSLLDYLLEWGQRGLRSPFKSAALNILFLHCIQTRKRLPLEEIVGRLLSFEGGAPLKSLPKDPSVSNPINESEEKKLVPSLEEKLIEAIRKDNVSSDSVPAPPTLSENASSSSLSSIQIDTLLRFAAVELEGTLHFSPQNKK